MKNRTPFLFFGMTSLAIGLFCCTSPNSKKSDAAGCGNADSAAIIVDSDTTSSQLNEWVLPPESAEQVSLETTEQEQAFVKSNNKFAMDCYAQVRKMDSSSIKFFSPISLNIALGVCANGASKKGAKEITDALGFQGENALEEMNDFYQKICNSLNIKTDDVEMHTANALWVNQGTPVRNDFIKAAKEKYYATVRHLDFKNNPSAAKSAIDHWAALVTKDRIQSLGVDITDSTRLLINNACYFGAKWMCKFKLMPKKRKFYGTNKKPELTTFMNIDYIRDDCQLACAETRNYQAVKLYYNDDYYMIVVLPKKGYALDNVLPSIQWNTIPFKIMNCILFMPKFESRGFYTFEHILNDLNINDIFSSYPAVFDPKENVKIGQVRQDFFLSVSEEGTEAAAVTSITVLLCEVEDEPDPVFHMDCNRPFAFAICEKKTGLLLFLGEYDDVP